MKKKWLVKLRKVKGYTQQQVADQAYLDRSYYAQIENGLKQPSMAVAKKLAGVLGFHYSIFELEASPFSIALEHSPMILAHCDRSLRYTWLFNPHQDFDPSDSIGMTDTEMEDNEGTRTLEELKRDVMESGENARKRVAFPLSEGTITYEVFCHPLFNEEGEVTGAATTAVEIDKINEEK